MKSSIDYKPFNGLSQFTTTIQYTLLFISISFLACRQANDSIEWSIQESNTDYLLTAVEFVNEQEGYAVGGDSWYFGVVAHTKDGGTTWQSDSLFNKILWNLTSDKDKNLYATGVNAEILELPYGTINWKTNLLPTWEIMRGLAFWDKTKGVLVGGEAYQSGYIALIQNNQLDSLWETDFELQDVYFSDSNTVHAVGYGIILKSIDNGKHWEKAPIYNDYFRSVHFPTANTGFVVGATGTILKTTDKGKSWEVLRDGDDLHIRDIPFRSVFFEDEQTGYIVGDKGVFWCTKNGGDDWEVIRDLPNLNFYDVFAVNNKGWIVGENGIIISFEF